MVCVNMVSLTFSNMTLQITHDIVVMLIPSLHTAHISPMNNGNAALKVCHAGFQRLINVCCHRRRRDRQARPGHGEHGLPQQATGAARAYAWR